MWKTWKRKKEKRKKKKKKTFLRFSKAGYSPWGLKESDTTEPVTTAQHRTRAKKGSNGWSPVRKPKWGAKREWKDEQLLHQRGLAGYYVERAEVGFHKNFSSSKLGSSVVFDFSLSLSFFFPLIFISWRLITLQYYSGFFHTLTWISHGFICVPHPDPPSHLPLHPITLGLPSAPGPSACLMHPTWAGDLFHPR